MSVLIESMTKIKFRNYTIRLWIEEQSLEEFDQINRAQLQNTVGQILHNHIHPYFPCRNLAIPANEILDTVEDINAVEITDKEGDGVVLYKDWP